MSERYCKDCRYCHHANIGLLCMGQKGMPHTSPYGSCDSWKSAKQTNADRIRAMSDKELAKWLDDISKACCYEGYTKETDEPQMSPYPTSPAKWVKWLKQEASE